MMVFVTFAMGLVTKFKASKRYEDLREAASYLGILCLPPVAATAFLVGFFVVRMTKFLIFG